MKIIYFFLILLIPATVYCNFLDYGGFGTRSIGLAGAMTAGANDFTATFYNPALIPLFSNISVGAGFQGFSPKFFINRDLPICGSNQNPTDTKCSVFGNRLPASASGFSVGWAIPIDFKKAGKAGLGVAFYFPSTHFVRAESINIEYPHYPIYDYDFNRLGFVVSLGWSFNKFLSIGIGAQILTDVYGDQYNNFDLPNSYIKRQDITVESYPKIAAVAGIVFTPINRLRIGLSYHQQLDLAYHLHSIMTFEELASFDMAYTLISAFSPHRFNIGFQYTPTKKLNIFADLSYALWKNMPLPSPATTVNVAGTLIDDTGFAGTLNLTSEEHWKKNDLANQLSGSIAMSWHVLSFLKLNLGFRYIPTFIKNESEAFNYLDNNVFAISYGASFIIHFQKSLKLTIAMAGTTGLLFSRTVVKKDLKNPTGDYTHGGYYQIYGININADY